MKYNNDTLFEFCNSNNICLIKDYMNIKIERESVIEGNCKLNNCINKFNKNFRQLVKTGPYCKTCIIKRNKIKNRDNYKFNTLFLNTFCEQNSIILKTNYSNVDINRDTIIEGQCLTINCNNIFSKSFRELIKLNGYCNHCCKEIGKNKIIQTTFKKYGVNHIMQSAIFKEKVKNIIFEKYGVTHISKLESIKQQKKEKSLVKYGSEYILQSPIIREKIKETNIQRYGFENPQQCDDVKNKTANSIYHKFGVKYYFQTNEFKSKTIQTNLEKYGVSHHSQNVDVSEKMLNNSYNKKLYTMPSGKLVKYQGYENFALDDLLYNENIDETDIITNRTDVPEIWYNDKYGEKRRHYVDIYIKTQNRCIEVKSIWTNQPKNNVFEKQLAAINMGYIYQIWIFNKNGYKIATY